MREQLLDEVYLVTQNSQQQWLLGFNLWSGAGTQFSCRARARTAPWGPVQGPLEARKNALGGLCPGSEDGRWAFAKD